MAAEVVFHLGGVPYRITKPPTPTLPLCWIAYLFYIAAHPTYVTVAYKAYRLAFS